MCEHNYDAGQYDGIEQQSKDSSGPTVHSHQTFQLRLRESSHE
tara:strand:+ start:39420 stop:39548 length:129 start_codon:yes stop_codon:yes gene_type:complete